MEVQRSRRKTIAGCIPWTEREEARMSGTGRPGGLLAPLEASSRVDDVTDRLVTAVAVGEYRRSGTSPPPSPSAA
jgi:hypothetical protein